jgi:hypothetical protein
LKVTIINGLPISTDLLIRGVVSEPVQVSGRVRGGVGGVKILTGASVSDGRVADDL